MMYHNPVLIFTTQKSFNIYHNMITGNKEMQHDFGIEDIDIDNRIIFFRY